jgi:hypothetical protein
MLHHSANGVSEGVDWPSPEVAPRFKLGPSQDWVSSVLFAAYWTYGLLFLGLLRRLSPERVEDFDKFLVERGGCFQESSDE